VPDAKVSVAVTHLNHSYDSSITVTDEIPGKRKYNSDDDTDGYFALDQKHSDNIKGSSNNKSKSK
jgi:hypothetical protein